MLKDLPKGRTWIKRENMTNIQFFITFFANLRLSKMTRNKNFDIENVQTIGFPLELNTMN